MSFLTNLFNRKSSAPVARDRLQILLAHERASLGEGKSDLLVQLQKEIMEVISRHVAVDQDKVQVKLDRGSGCSMLEIDIEVPGIEQNGKEKKDDAHPV
ncbi:cell division topological specificity factor MinE [Acetobacter sp.]|jgi:cell division topological specificity factor|uniref:cell division topological specificity factor MinE n=1 Tax=Acetobacter sp. TaxID=440 RepID=UPI0025B89466|nr:cell division topological specificity factor MinE [Acetobacter sp.]MCH4090072.1 cell division topological specificity factor MinE [Acetobacter sp.]MCI1298768.1 cell division topological specificity factor MinE [Acetobacter sp.]MCI1314787.1 cell division topological specificity factor MinE [Acetobacter sp.]